MNILFVGDVVGQDACLALKSFLPSFKRETAADITIINGENSADGNGITPYSADLLFEAGADVITTGNHCFKRQEMDNVFNTNPFILRPANYGENPPGKGFCIIDRGRYSVAVTNITGTTYMTPADNPFNCIDEILNKIKTENIIVDFHAEATAEKKAMGFYLAGRVSAAAGTHTHVQTADEQIISDHTGYITDVGMTGVRASVLGIEKDVIIERLQNYYPKKHALAKGEYFINAILLEIDEKSGKCLSVSRINRAM